MTPLLPCCVLVAALAGVSEPLALRVHSYIDNVALEQHPEMKFFVTKIGCGIAGFATEEIAPLFADALDVENVILPQEFVL